MRLLFQDKYIVFFVYLKYIFKETFFELMFYGLYGSPICHDTEHNMKIPIVKRLKNSRRHNIRGLRTGEPWYVFRAFFEVKGVHEISSIFDFLFRTCPRALWQQPPDRSVLITIITWYFQYHLVNISIPAWNSNSVLYAKAISRATRIATTRGASKIILLQ